MATLRDIAKVCGVSTATVSYVVNRGPRPVLPATRDRVMKVVAELGYHPNAHARGLRGLRTQTIGVIFPHITLPFENPYFGPVLADIVEVTTERHLATMLFTGLTWEEAENSAPKLCDGRCDGFILVAPQRESILVRELAARDLPIVIAGTHPESVDVPTVDADNVAGARMATEHLIKLGHRRIGITPSSLTATCSWERMEGYRLALEDSGIPYDEDLVSQAPAEGFGGREEVEKLLSRPEPPTAIFTVQDETAMEAVALAEGMGLRVPEDLSVIGFDDIPAVRTFDPPITTVRQPMRDVGYRSAQLLCERIDAPAAVPDRLLLDVELIHRSSTAPPRAGAARAT